LPSYDADRDAARSGQGRRIRVSRADGPGHPPNASASPSAGQAPVAYRIQEGALGAPSGDTAPTRQLAQQFKETGEAQIRALPKLKHQSRRYHQRRGRHFRRRRQRRGPARSPGRFRGDLRQPRWARPGARQARPRRSRQSNTGNFIDSGSPARQWRPKRGIESNPYGPIPYASEQGIFCRLAGN
jgi:hypothetical protein